MESSNAMRILGIVQPQQLTRKDLPFRPNSARNFRGHRILEGFRYNPACHGIGILIAPAQQPCPFIGPAKVKRAESDLRNLRLSGQGHADLPRTTGYASHAFKRALRALHIAREKQPIETLLVVLSGQ
jgi:hypothetical protein